MQATEWIVIANSAKARVFARTPGKPLRVVHSFEHPQSRRHTADLGDDRAGRDMRAGGTGGSAFVPRADLHEKEHRRFAREVCEFLEREARANAFDSMSILAPEPFLGELREALGSVCRKRLRSAGGPDLSHVGEAELEARVHAALDQAA